MIMQSIQSMRIPWITILALVLTKCVAEIGNGDHHMKELSAEKTEFLEDIDKDNHITLFTIDDFRNLTQVCFIYNYAGIGKSLKSSGTGNFYDFITKSDVWVDKSLLAAEVLNTNDRVVLLTTPRKFGKSLNLSMLKLIFEYNIERNFIATQFFMHGYVVENRYYTGFTKQIPLISKNQEFMAKYFRKTPVLYLDMKDVGVCNFREMLMQVIAVMYKEHLYLRNYWYNIIGDITLPPYEIVDAKSNIETFDKYVNQLYSDDGDLQLSIVWLCKVLYKYHNRECIVLIDEFDSVQNDLLMGYEGTISANDDPIKFIRTFMSITFKNAADNHIEKGILTGITRLAKSNLMGGLNNILADNDLNLINMATLTPFYGFTWWEVETILQQMQPNTWKIDYQTAVTKYDGYNSLCLSEGSIFNPWAIMRFYPHRVAEAYWEQTGSNLAIEKLLRYEFFENSIYDILRTNKGYEIETNVLHTIKNGMLDKIRDLLITKENPIYYEFVILRGTDTTILNSLMAFMVQSGYLTIENDPQQRAMKNMKKVKLMIPNLAMAEEMNTILTNSLVDKTKVRKFGNYDTVLAECVTLFTEWFKLDFASKSEYDSGDMKTSLEGLRQNFEKLFEQSGIFTDLTDLKYTQKPAQELLLNHQHLSEAAVRKTLSAVFEKFRQDAKSTAMEEWSQKENGYLDTQFFIGDRMVIVEYKSNRSVSIDGVLEQAMKYTPLILGKKRIYKWVKFLAINFFQKNKKDKPTLELAHYGMTWSELEDYVRQRFQKTREQLQKKCVTYLPKG